MKTGQLISLITLFVFLVPYFSFAQFAPPESFAPPSIPTRLFSCSPNDTLRICMLKLLGDALRVVLVIALVFSALMIAFAGISYIAGGEDPAKRAKLNTRIIYAAVGLVFAFLSWVITVIISRIISGAAI